MKRFLILLFSVVASFMVAGHFHSAEILFASDSFSLIQALTVQSAYYVVDIIYALTGRSGSKLLRYSTLLLTCVLLVVSKLFNADMQVAQYVELSCHVFVTIVGDLILHKVCELVRDTTRHDK